MDKILEVVNLRKEYKDFVLDNVSFCIESKSIVGFIGTNGSGKSFRFDKFGHSISITYSDLQDVIAVNRTFIEDGTVYICDADVVKNNYLDEYYNRFLTVEKITNILSFSKSDIVDMVSNTTETIQETIISLIVKKINNNEYVDMNKVEAIGKSCKTPCDIPTLALQKRIK